MAEEQPDLRWVLVAAEPMTDVDTTAADMLVELDSWLNTRGVSLAFAEVKDPVRAKIQRYELERTIDPVALLPDPRRGRHGLHGRDGSDLAGPHPTAEEARP